MILPFIILWYIILLSHILYPLYFNYFLFSLIFLVLLPFFFIIHYFIPFVNSLIRCYHQSFLLSFAFSIFHSLLSFCSFFSCSIIPLLLPLNELLLLLILPSFPLAMNFPPHICPLFCHVPPYSFAKPLVSYSTLFFALCYLL